MDIEPLNSRLQRYVVSHGLEKKLKKQLALLKQDVFNKGLNFEKLVPHPLGLYSFRLDRQYRAICVVEGNGLEIVDINNHYR